jgi:hypothetical protein
MLNINKDLKSKATTENKIGTHTPHQGLHVYVDRGLP